MVFVPIHDGNPLRHINRPWVAWGIIAVNALVFVVELATGPEIAAYTLGLVPAALNGEVPRPDELMQIPEAATLVTYSFVHADLMHLIGNMIFLWVLGDNVEDAFGHLRYLAFYLLCALAAGYAFVLSAPDSGTPVIGASGAVGGTVAAYLLLHPRARIWILVFLRIPIRLPAMYVLGFWVIFQFAAVFGFGETEIAWWAHIGGLVAGAVLVVFMRRRGVPLFAGEASTPPAAGGDGGRGPQESKSIRGPWRQ